MAMVDLASPIGLQNVVKSELKHIISKWKEDIDKVFAVVIKASRGQEMMDDDTERSKEAREGL